MSVCSVLIAMVDPLDTAVAGLPELLGLTERHQLGGALRDKRHERRPLDRLVALLSVVGEIRIYAAAPPSSSSSGRSASFHWLSSIERPRTAFISNRSSE